MGAILGRFFFWLGQSKLGQLAFSILIEKIVQAIKESVAREQERRRKILEKKKLMEDLEMAKTKEEQQNATNALARYLGDK